MRNLRVTIWAAVCALSGCVGTTSNNTGVDNDAMVSANEDEGTISEELSAGEPIGSILATTANLNLRTGASTAHSVRLVIPKGAHVTTVNTSKPSNGWYNIKYNGTVGWSSGTYLKLISKPASGGSTIASKNRAGAVLRAKAGLGFSYWWGHGRWLSGGPSSSTKGSCYGSCPNCTHHGSYGADCSGYVGKIWEVPSSNSSLSSDDHPYSTVSFHGSNSNWHTVSRSSLHESDALVYNSNGEGHIFLYEKGDGWGSMWAYEAKGCSYGIVHDLRTAGSAYKGIARTGY